MKLGIIALLLSIAGGPTWAQGGQGMRVYVDPDTGKFIEAPQEVTQPTPPAQPRRALPPPVVRPGTSPAGGVEMILDERFRASMEVAEVDGKPTIGCHVGESDPRGR